MGYLKDQPSAGRDKPALPEHVARMVKEFWELDERLQKLCTFMTTSRFAGLEPVAQGLLAEQKSTMQHYHYVLKRRLEMDGQDFDHASTYEKLDYGLQPVDPGSGAPAVLVPGPVIAEHLGEPVEIGGHDIDRDGPPPFTA